MEMEFSLQLQGVMQQPIVWGRSPTKSYSSEAQLMLTAANYTHNFMGRLDITDG